MTPPHPPVFFFFFNDTATTEIYTLSLHDALPISSTSIFTCRPIPACRWKTRTKLPRRSSMPSSRDRKSTRLNSSHGYISYAVFCLKKKKNTDWSCNTLAHHDYHSAFSARAVV